MRYDHPIGRTFLRQLGTVSVAIFATAAASLAGIGAGRAQAPGDLLIEPNTMVVLDFSGSMNRRSNDPQSPLKVVARRTATEILGLSSQIHPTGKTGLIVFGHREENGLKPVRDPAQIARSCQDIEVVSNPTENTPQQMRSVANFVGRIPEAKGQTPIMRSIDRAADLLDGGGSILLITDLDREVCVPIAPCQEAWARRIDEHRRSGVFVRHIVAVSKDRSNVRAIEELSECLKSSLHIVTSIDDARVVARAIVDDQVTISTPARLQLSYAYVDTPHILPPPGSGDGRADVTIEGRTTRKDFRLDGPGVTKTTQLPPGTHHVRLNLFGELYRHTVALVRSELSDHTFRIPTHHVQLRAVGIEGRPIQDDPRTSWTVAGLGGQISRISGNTLGLKLAPGSYSATVTVPGVVGKKQFKVSADRPPVFVEVALAGPTTHPTTPEPSISIGRATLNVELSADLTLFGEGLEDALELRLTSESGREVLTATRSSGSLSVKPGTYSVDLVVKAKSFPAGSYTFRAGEPYRVTIQYGGEALTVATNKPNEDTVWTVTDQKGSKHTFAGAELYQTVPPGTYSVTAMRAGINRTSTVTLPAAPSSNQNRTILIFD